LVARAVFLRQQPRLQQEIEASHRGMKPSTGELTMADIARMAGVSESTVSRALSGSTRIAPQTRARILELAKTARYAINEGARSLRLRRTRTIRC